MHSKGITMSAGGEYSRVTKGAKDVIDNAIPMVLEAVSTMNVGSEFVFSDMGTADGGTSLELVQRVISKVRAQREDAQITIVYSDQPGNDFNALMQTTLKLGENVFAYMAGASFFRQILPRGALSLGFSATAMHWLSAMPCNITGHVHAVGAKGAEREAFQNQGRKDWRTILRHRAAEMQSGSRAVIVNFCVDEKGQFLGNTGGVNMFQTFSDIWQSFCDAGRITQLECDAMTLPQYYCSVEELKEPLESQEEAVFQAGLRLEKVETRVVKCPFAAAFEEHRNVERFAKEFIPTIRSWNESIFRSKLAEGTSRDQIVEDFYETYRRRVVADEGVGHGMDYVHAYMVISKQEEEEEKGGKKI